MRMKSEPRKISRDSVYHGIKNGSDVQITKTKIENAARKFSALQDQLVWKQEWNSSCSIATWPLRTIETKTNLNQNNEVLDLSKHRRDASSLDSTHLYKIITNPYFLTNHWTDNENAKYTCVYCKKEFVSKSELAAHIDILMEKHKEITCCACSKKFTKLCYLRYHLKCHFDKVKYTCHICTKKYSRLDNLTRHNNLHINPNKFPCSTCERAFTRKDLLNKHEKCHDNKHRYQCSICSKYFKGYLSLKYHLHLYHSDQNV